MSVFDELMNASKEMSLENQSSSFDDEKYEREFWSPKITENGRTNVKIRFLPDPNGKYNFVKYFDRFYKNPETGRYLSEKCRTSLNEKDPIQNYCSLLWNKGEQGDETAKNTFKALKRKARYVANVLIIDDNLPEDESKNGQVVTYRFGAQIFKKLENAIKPEYDEEPIFPFALDNRGANFVIRSEMKGEFINFENSKFLSPGELNAEQTKSLKAFLKDNEMRDLKQYIDPANYKSFEELEKLLQEVVLAQPVSNEIVIEEADDLVTPAKDDLDDDVDSILGDDLDDDIKAFLDNIDD